MTIKPEALRLAMLLKSAPAVFGKTGELAADELRRLHEVNAELVAALKNYSLPIDKENLDLSRAEFGKELVRAELQRRAAIAKATGEQYADKL